MENKVTSGDPFWVLVNQGNRFKVSIFIAL